MPQKGRDLLLPSKVRFKKLIKEIKLEKIQSGFRRSPLCCLSEARTEHTKRPNTQMAITSLNMDMTW